MGEIYALFSAGDGIVRYVGKTLGSRAHRFEQHKKGVAIGRFVPRVEIWMRHEWRQGHPVECVLLQAVSNENCEELETEWMNKFPNLLNERKYNYRGGTPPIIPEIRIYMRSHRPNCGGFRGIHRWGEMDRYSVLAPDGEWLPGDSTPGWGRAIFFSDPTSALMTRERYAQRGNYSWLPDFEVAHEW